MTSYRLYCIGDDGRIADQQEHEAYDDLAALDRARAICVNYHSVEVWTDNRFVANMGSDGESRHTPEFAHKMLSPIRH